MANKSSSGAVFATLGFLIIVGIILFVIIRRRNKTVSVQTTSYATAEPQRPVLIPQPAPTIVMTQPAPVFMASPAPPSPVFVQTPPSPYSPTHSYPTYSSPQQPSAPPGY